MQLRSAFSEVYRRGETTLNPTRMTAPPYFRHCETKETLVDCLFLVLSYSKGKVQFARVTQMPTISIALATYNGSAFVAEQLESLAKQTVAPLELVVTDDSSTDDTIAIVEKFAATANFPVRIYRNDTRMGFRGNFMKAISLCGGDLVACCDQDDVWHPLKLERVSAAFGVDTKIKLVFHGAWLIDAQGERIGPANLLALPPRSEPLSFFPMLGVLGFAMTFRRELVGFNEYWPRSVDHLSTSNRMAHDQWYLFLASAIGDIVCLDERLVDYRQHGGNAYGVKPPTYASTIAYRLRNPRPYTPGLLGCRLGSG